MKRSAPFFLLTLLLMVPLVANAQTGWVRMPDGPWQQVKSLYFADSLHGCVEEYFPQSTHGQVIHLTSDGGLSWFSDSTLSRRLGYYCGGNGKVSDGIQVTAVSKFRGSKAIFGGKDQYWIACEVGNEHIGKISSLDLFTRTWGGIAGGRERVTEIEIEDSLITAVPFFCSDNNPGAFFRSTDLGRSWISTALPLGTMSLLTTRFQNPDTGFVVSRRYDGLQDRPHLIRTMDGGKEWIVMNDSIGPSSRLAIGSISYGNDQRWYCYDDQYEVLYSSEDVGLNWSIAETLPRLSPDKPDDAFYSLSSGYKVEHSDSLFSLISFTDDSGLTWEAHNGVKGYLIEISAPSERVAYAVGPNGLLYKTTDGGGRFADVKQREAKSGAIRAWSSGDDIMIEGASGKEVRIFDLLGRLVRSGLEDRFEGMKAGAYVVICAGESARVLVSP